MDAKPVGESDGGAFTPRGSGNPIAKANHNPLAIERLMFPSRTMLPAQGPIATSSLAYVHHRTSQSCMRLL